MSILFLVNDDWYFVSHRLAFAQRLRAAGHQVAVACCGSGMQTVITSAGVSLFELPFARGSLSLRQAIREVLATRRLVQTFRPDIVHQVALRRILLGTLACTGLRAVKLLNAIAGLGSLFVGTLHAARLRWTRRLVRIGLRLVLRHPRAVNVFQNPEDLEEFVGAGLSPRARSFLVRGTGVDPSAWTPRPEIERDVPVVLFVGRLLKDKGLGELVQASRTLNDQGVRHVLRLIGWVDAWNPKSFTEAEVRAWQEAGRVEWLGKRDDVLDQMSQANVIALPSYREGLPRVLLEAGLAERAVVASDVPGCREVIVHEQSGLLTPPADAAALAAALQRVLTDCPLRRRLAGNLHQRVCRDFSLDQVVDRFVQIYEQMLVPPPARAPAAMRGAPVLA